MVGTDVTVMYGPPENFGPDGRKVLAQNNSGG
jgi:hypothetical protein